jgi:hypothetical protein
MITKDDTHKFDFLDYRKVGTTKISVETLPAGTMVQTLEGLWTCKEPSKLALDAAGNVYPIAVSIFERCYTEE